MTREIRGYVFRQADIRLPSKWSLDGPPSQLRTKTRTEPALSEPKGAYAPAEKAPRARAPAPSQRVYEVENRLLIGGGQMLEVLSRLTAFLAMPQNGVSQGD